MTRIRTSALDLDVKMKRISFQATSNPFLPCTAGMVRTVADIIHVVRMSSYMRRPSRYYESCSAWSTVAGRILRRWRQLFVLRQRVYRRLFMLLSLRGTMTSFSGSGVPSPTVLLCSAARRCWAAATSRLLRLGRSQNALTLSCNLAVKAKLPSGMRQRVNVFCSALSNRLRCYGDGRQSEVRVPKSTGPAVYK
jgi:hypothetical protein